MTATAPASPRSDSEPMAFTRDEFWFGAWSTVGCFLGLLAVAEIVLGVVDGGFAGLLVLVLPVSLIIAAVVSVTAMMLASPVVRRLAWHLRSNASIRVHLLAHGACGAMVGALTTLILTLLMPQGTASASLLVGSSLTAAALTAASAMLGWGFALRNARRWDRRQAMVQRMKAHAS